MKPGYSDVIPKNDQLLSASKNLPKIHDSIGNNGIMVSIGNHPQMAELFRLVNYYNLPRMMINV